jgi:DNA-binding transcriptional LysR family regulator
VELRHLRYFIAVAECGGFIRAADYLHVAQPALSRQIRDLEAELKVVLFERSGRGVRLTFAGQGFLQDARHLLASLEQAESRARRAQSGELGELSIGMIEAFTWHEVIIRSIRSFRDRSPDVVLTVAPMNSPEQLTAIRDRRLTAGFLCDRPLEDKTFDGVEVLTDGELLAVPDTSRFAAHPPQRLHELADEDCVFFPRTVNPQYYDKVIQACRESGFMPKIVQWGTNDSSNLSLVAAGLGYTFVPCNARWRKPRNVVLVPVEDLNIVSTMEFVWRRDNQQQALKNFVALFKGEHPPRAEVPQTAES